MHSASHSGLRDLQSSRLSSSSPLRRGSTPWSVHLRRISRDCGMDPRRQRRRCACLGQARGWRRRVVRIYLSLGGRGYKIEGLAAG